MAVISRDLGPVTAYAAAVNRGYTGTREEFETLMASYATVAEQAGESAESAEESAASAAQSAASASQSAQNAEGSKYDALLYSNQANGYKNTANTAAQAAKDARDAAQSAQTAAEAAQAGAEAAVDGFDDTVTAAISDVNAAGTNQKELAKRQAEKSEAWAVGKINGEDVGVSDPAYHNNAKYYAESAGTSATTTTTKASEAAQSAANAAASASAAAESARTLTIDPTLTQSGQAADSKVVGDKIGAIKSDLSDVESTIFIDEQKNISLELGTISLSDGAESASYTRAKTGFISFDDETQVVAESGAKYAFRFYKADNTWAGAPTVWYTGTNAVKTLASTYTGAVKMRLVCAYSDDRDIQQRAAIDALELLIKTTAVGNKIEILDNRITDAETVEIPLIWKIGSIGVNNGQDGISTIRQRTPDYYEYNPNAVIKIDTGAKYNIFAYDNQYSFLWGFGYWQTTGGTVESVIDRNNKDANAVKYLRFSVAYSDDATIANVVTLGNYFHLSEKWDMQECFERQERSDRISVSKSGTGNFSIRCAKEQSYTDGTAPVIEWFLLEEPVTGRFYYSKNLKDKFYLFTFPYETYMYSFGILQNGDIIAVLDADSIETENKSDSNRVNPYVFLASENWGICHEVNFGSSLKPCGWLSNCGFKVLADGSAIFCEYTRQTTHTANVWRLSGVPTDPTNWVVAKSFVVTSTDNSTLFKHCHMVMQDFYTGICYMATGDDNVGSMLWASTDNGQTWTQLASPDSDGEVNEYGYINGSEKYCRMLTMTFTEDYIYWASDTPTASLHYLFRAERDETTGVLDYSTVSDYVNIPAESGASTYGTAYLPEINAILLLDRCDTYSQSMPVRLIDLTSGMLKTIGTLYVTDNEKATGASLGFRTRFSEWYPFNCFVRVGFGLRGNHYNNDINHNRGFGNTGTWISGGGKNNINNLGVQVFKDGNMYGMQLRTFY